MKGKGKQPSRQILSSDDEELAPLSKRAENVKKSTQASNTTSSKFRYDFIFVLLADINLTVFSFTS